uniref:Uncharacterized protein n=1 Tax=Xiphophorus couchianus TaxID=32473 RepID=A0A3B5MH97_9TELE
LLIFHQGMLDPTKDPPPKPSTSSAQVARNTDISLSEQELPSNQPDWSCRGHSSSQEGVDRELYKLIISKLEADNKTSQIEDTLNRLMSAAESTSISARKPSAQEELSGEAGRMISELPDLSFMQAKVLMFPVFLTPEAHSSPKLL